jgi:nitrogen-specific signal transduction histidine kinase
MWILTSAPGVIAIALGLVIIAIRVRRLERRLHAVSRDLERVREECAGAVHAERALLRNLSFQLRSSATGALGMTGLALDGELSPGQRECLLSAQGATQSLLELLNHLTEFSRASREDRDGVPASIALDGLLSETLRGFVPEARAKGLKLALDVARGVPEHVKCDAIRLRQILGNLLRNAIQYTHQGEVTVTVACHPRAGSLIFEVVDTGPGIPSAHMDGLFDGFEATGTPVRGLGLAITRRLVESLGGRIGVESAPGTGSRFWFELPADAVSERPPQTRHEAANPADRVLILDPHPASSRVLMSYASQWNGLSAGEGDRASERTTNVAVARSIEALVMLDQAERAGIPFRVLLVDDPLEDRTPAEVVAAIRVHRRFDQVRIVVLASQDPAVYRTLEHHSAVRVLPQPASRRELWDAMAEQPCLAPVPSATSEPVAVRA